MKINALERRITALLMVLLLLSTAFSLYAAAESFTAEVTVSKMTVRSGADTSYPVIATLSKGKIVTVLAYSNGVAQISFDGQTGYALVSNLKKIGSQNSSASGSQDIISLSGIGTVTAASASIYASSSTSSKVIYTAKRGQSYTVLSTDGTWAKIQNGSHTAYILLSSISINTSVTATPDPLQANVSAAYAEPTPTGLATILNNKTKLYAKASTTSKVVTTLDKGDTFTILDLDETWVKLQNGKYEAFVLRSGVSILPGVTATPTLLFTPTATATPTATPKPTAPDTNLMNAIGSAKVDANLVYIYSQPDGSSNKIVSLGKGKKVTLYSNASGWALVQYGSITGYVKSDGLTLYYTQGDSTASPMNGAIAENANIAVFTNCSAPIYKTQSTSSSKLKQLAIGTELTLLGHNGTWALVKYGSTKGYMQLAALTSVESATMYPSMNAIATVTASKATFYKYASSSSKKVGTLNKGTELTILASDSTWALVQYKENTGYCTLSSLSEIKNPTIGENENTPYLVVIAAAVYEYASTSSNKLLSSLAKDTPITVLGHNNNWALVASGSKTGYMQMNNLRKMSEVSLKSDESYTATITASGTVRKYMYDSSGSAGKISKGHQVNVLGHNATWALIEKNGNKGYYPLSNMKLQLDEFGAPTVKTMEATVIRNASVYSKALESASKIGSITPGTDVTITAYTSKWARISYGSSVAYILRSYVSNISYTTLKPGSSSSSDILKLQKTLENLGYFDGLPAGNYGSLTTNAVTRFQTQIGISATGIADQSTLRVLYGGYAPECSIKTASLSKGASGNNVTRLQTRLTYKGYLSAGIDGDYGALTVSEQRMYRR